MTEGEGGQCVPYPTNWIHDHNPDKYFTACARYKTDTDCTNTRDPIACWWDDEYPYGCCKQDPKKPANCHLGRKDCMTNYEHCYWDMQQCNAKSCAKKCTPEQCKGAICSTNDPYACLNENNHLIGCRPNSEGWDVPGPNPCTSCCDIRSCMNN